MKKYLFLICLVVSVRLLATGPSSIVSEIKPISINSKGEILCKTKFSENRTGA